MTTIDVKPTSNGCLQRTGRTKTASGIVVYLIEELGDARLRAAQLKQYVSAALELVDKSDKRDHLFEVAAHLIHGIPDTLFRLDKALDAAAMAAARMDYEEIKQGLKPEKAEELERVLGDVRLQYLKRRSSIMNTKEAASSLDKLAQGTVSTGSVPTADLARLINRLEQGHKTAASKDPLKVFCEAAEYLRTTPNPSRRGLVATLRHVLAESLVAEDVEAGAGEEFKKVNPDISDEAVEKIDRMHEKYEDKVTGKVTGKEAAAPSEALAAFEQASLDAKVAYGVASRGNERLAAIRGLEAIRSMMVALGHIAPEHADKLLALNEKLALLRTAIKADASKADVLQRQASVEVPSNIMQRMQLLSAFQVLSLGGSGGYGISRKDALDVIGKILDVSLSPDVSPPKAGSVADYVAWLNKQVDSDESGKTASLTPVADDWKAARFEEGKPADPTENMSEEDADEWRAMTEEHGDNFKSAKLMSRQEAILKKYIEGGGDAMMFEDLPSNVRKDLSKVKDQETLHSDADRWLGDNNNPHLRSKWASTDLWKVTASADPAVIELLEGAAILFSTKYAKTRFTRNGPEVNQHGDKYILNAHLQPYNDARVDSIFVLYDVSADTFDITVSGSYAGPDVESQGFGQTSGKGVFKHLDSPAKLANAILAVSRKMS